MSIAVYRLVIYCKKLFQGFSMVGEPTTACQTNSTWSSPPPRFLKENLIFTPRLTSRCDAITCPPEKLSHAVKVYNNASFKVDKI